MDRQEHKEARLSTDTTLSGGTLVLPNIQICFPPALGLENKNVWGEVIDKYRIMTVKEWLKNKKAFFTIQENEPIIIGSTEFTPSKAIASRYAEKQINHNFYGPIRI
jgi:hypothetical protein